MGRNSLLANLSWKFAERILAQIVTTVVAIILARLLEPSHYGIISIVTIFITLANVFVSDGFGSALIQKKNADRLDFSSVLVFNLGFACVLYLLLFFSAPHIASFYGEGYEQLIPVLRILSLRLIFSAINSVQHAYVSKNMIFQKFFWATLLGTVLSAVVGITMAYMGFGVWALVAQYMTNTTVDTIVLGISLKVKPSFGFSFGRLKGMVGYGARILGTNLMISGFVELRALIIGKMYSTEDLAFYDRARHYPNLIVGNITSSISAVLFPQMANEQDDRKRIKEATRSSIRFSAYIMCPMMLGLAAVAEPFVELVLTEKWLPCVPMMKLFCLVYLFQPIHAANAQAIKAIGRSDIFFRLEVIKKVTELCALIVVMWISVDAIVISMAILATMFTFVNAYPNARLLDYTFGEQMRDILPAISMALVMAGTVSLIGYIQVNLSMKLVIQLIVGIMIYMLLSLVTKNKELRYMLFRLRKK